MAVNGVELAIGQTWITRDGDKAVICGIGNDLTYPVAVNVDGIDRSYTKDGVHQIGVKDAGLDLVQLEVLQPAAKISHAERIESGSIDDTQGGIKWVAWRGGDCPVPSHTPVRARLRSGVLVSSKAVVAAGDLAWAHTGAGGDIVEYMALPLSTSVSKPSLPNGFANDGSRYGSLRMDVDGYERLADVLLEAYGQAARGKGAERHANNRPFHEQPMLSICRNLGSVDGMLYQASKKAMEARGLPTRERALAEIYGAINYLAGAAILIEEGIIKGQE